MKRTASETREKLILAATHVILAEGINQMTLESVAQAAGVSKGGLLYHFPSKDALIEGMVDAVLARFEARLEASMNAQVPDEKSSDVTAAGATYSADTWLKAYIEASAVYEPEEVAIGSGLLAALTVNPTLLKPLHERYRIWQNRLMQTSDPVLSTLIRLTLDGLWLCDLTGLAPPDPALREQVLKRLLEIK